MKVPVIGGVRDGDDIVIPRSALPNHYGATLRNQEQTTDYVLRQSADTQAMVAEGLKWPLLTGAAA